MTSKSPVWCITDDSLCQKAEEAVTERHKLPGPGRWCRDAGRWYGTTGVSQVERAEIPVMAPTVSSITPTSGPRRSVSAENHTPVDIRFIEYIIFTCKTFRITGDSRQPYSHWYPRAWPMKYARKRSSNEKPHGGCCFASKSSRLSLQAWPSPHRKSRIAYSDVHRPVSKINSKIHSVSLASHVSTHLLIHLSAHLCHHHHSHHPSLFHSRLKTYLFDKSFPP